MRVVLFCSVLSALACGSTGIPTGDGGGPGTDLSGGGADFAQSGSSDLAMSGSSDLSQPGGDLAGAGLCCGQPGDVGNNLGVGKYCNGFGDCTGMANLCANLGDPQLHFCTMICQQGGNCGTGATCQCQGGQCGCFPDSCLSMPASC
ncbi:MAG TPA: hypothetical protein VFF06_13820 [Polyangia bacterium]|nr:hypothetical protein [Polyangia bacterium]